LLNSQASPSTRKLRSLKLIGTLVNKELLNVFMKNNKNTTVTIRPPLFSPSRGTKELRTTALSTKKTATVLHSKKSAVITLLKAHNSNRLVLPSAPFSPINKHNNMEPKVQSAQSLPPDLPSTSVASPWSLKISMTAFLPSLKKQREMETEETSKGDKERIRIRLRSLKTSTRKILTGAESTLKMLLKGWDSESAKSTSGIGTKERRTASSAQARDAYEECFESTSIMLI
jgi:hypothetical protein